MFKRVCTSIALATSMLAPAWAQSDGPTTVPNGPYGDNDSLASLRSYEQLLDALESSVQTSQGAATLHYAPWTSNTGSSGALRRDRQRPDRRADHRAAARRRNGDERLGGQLRPHAGEQLDGVEGDPRRAHRRRRAARQRRRLRRREGRRHAAHQRNRHPGSALARELRPALHRQSAAGLLRSAAAATTSTAITRSGRNARSTTRTIPNITDAASSVARRRTSTAPGPYSFATGNPVPEAKNIRWLNDQFKPVVALDMHHQGTRVHDGKMVTASTLYPTAVATATRLLGGRPERASTRFNAGQTMAKRVVVIIAQTLAQYPYADLSRYPGGTEPGISRNAYGLLGARARCCSSCAAASAPSRAATSRRSAIHASHGHRRASWPRTRRWRPSTPTWPTSWSFRPTARDRARATGRGDRRRLRARRAGGSRRLPPGELNPSSEQGRSGSAETGRVRSGRSVRRRQLTRRPRRPLVPPTPPMLGEHAQALAFGIVHEDADERVLVARHAEGAGLRAGPFVGLALHQPDFGALELRREGGIGVNPTYPGIGADGARLRVGGRGNEGLTALTGSRRKARPFHDSARFRPGALRRRARRPRGPVRQIGRTSSASTRSARSRSRPSCCASS